MRNDWILQLKVKKQRALRKLPWKYKLTILRCYISKRHARNFGFRKIAVRADLKFKKKNKGRNDKIAAIKSGK